MRQPLAMIALTIAFTACAGNDLRAYTARDLVEVADIESVQLAPDGDSIALALHRPLVDENTIDQSIWLVSLHEKFAPRRLTSAGAPIWNSVGLEQPIAPQWSPDSKWIYFRGLEAGEVQIWRVDLSGRREQVTHEPGDVLDFLVDARGRLLYRTDVPRAEIIAAEQREDRIGVHVDGSVEVQMDLAHNDDYGGRRITLRRDPLFRHLGPAPSGAVKTRDSSNEAVLSAEEKAEYSALIEERVLGLFATPERMDVRSSRLGQGEAWVQRDRKELPPAHGKAEKYEKAMRRRPDIYRVTARFGTGAQLRTCADPQCVGTKLRVLGWREREQEVVFLRQEADGSSAIYAWPSAGAVRRIFASDGLLGVGTSLQRFNSGGCPLSDREAICSVASAASPPRLVALDLDSGRSRTLFDPNAGLRHESLGKSRIVHWTDANGIPESGVLTLPTDFRPRRRIPLVVTSYRCEGFLRGGFGMDVPEHLLAQAGIATLCANYAGHLLVLDDDQPIILTSLQQDAQSWEYEIRELIKQGLVDACRVGASGTSHGSATAAHAIWNSRLYNAVALSNPWELDPSTFYFFGAPDNWFITQTNPIKTFYGLPDPAADRAEWKKVSPALNVDKTHAAVLMQVPDTEFRLGMEYYTRMTLANRPVDMIAFFHESHVKRQPAHREVVYRRNVAWFRFWLQNFVDEHSPLENDYSSWNDLKAKALADSERQAAFRARSEHSECEPGWF